MDRRIRLCLAATGLGLMTMGAGCKSLFHRHEVPPEPIFTQGPATPAQFGADTQDLRAAQGPLTPAGPVAASPGGYGPSGPNGRPTTPLSGAPDNSGAPASDPFTSPASAPLSLPPEASGEGGSGVMNPGS